MHNPIARSLGLLTIAMGAANAAPRPDFHADGSVQIGAETFPSMSDYFQSQTFRDSGARCGSMYTPSAVSIFAAADCSLNRTTINPAYNDGRTLVIQVVFHVIKKTDGTGALPEALVKSQIDILNEDYNAIAGSNGAMGTNAHVKFVLARFDPKGAATNGIEVVTNDAFFKDPGSGGAANAMKTALHWDTSRYLNIYTNDAAGLLGYATFPQESAGDPDDGVVVLYSSVGRNAPNAAPYDLGRTATHEVGHYLGLLHTFQSGCGTANAPYTSGDLISDTIREQQANFRCTPAASACDATKMNPIENYMDYSDDKCMTKFTVEQSNRLRCSLINFRKVNTEPKAVFTVTVADGVATFANTSTDAESQATALHYNWTFGDGSTSTEANPTHTYAVDGNYNATLEVVDENSAAGTAMQSVMITGKPAQPDAGADPGGDDTGPGGMAGGGCCQAPRDGATWALLGVPVAFVLLRRRRR